MRIPVKRVTRQTAGKSYPLRTLALPGLALVLGTGLTQQIVAQPQDAPVPAELTAAANADPAWEAPRLSWGHPNLEGTFTSRDMSGIPLERPAQFGERESLNDEEFQQRAGGGPGGLAALRAGEEFEGEARLQLSALDSSEVGTRTFGYSSYVIEPANGRVPALTAEGEQRQAAFRGGQSNGPYFTIANFSYYDRCITRGISGSIMPSLYGDAMRIVQSPTEVAISYEMLHDTRIIPLDGRAFPEAGVSQYMGSSVGHFEGDTLVVETRNLTDKLAIGRYTHSTDVVLTERFTRIDPDMINYIVTVDDPRTFTAPWTFRLTLTTQPNYEILEYSCHEGNFFVANALRAEQRYQQSVDEARAKGEPVPVRQISDGGLDIYQAPSSEQAVDINAAQ
jgi:hypothetical protein